MSTVFRNLSDEDLRVQNEDALIPTEYTFDKKLRGLKRAILFAFILSFVALGAAIYLYLTLSYERAERQSIEDTQIELEETSEVLGQQVGQYRAVIEGLREQVQAYVEERKNFKEEFSRSQQEITSLQEKLSSVENRNQAIEVQINEIVQSAPPVAAVIEGPRPGTISPAPTTATDSDSFDLGESSDKWEGESTAVVSEPPSVMESAQVLTVNKKFNFVVINVGIEDGTRIGDEKNIIREGQVIGQVKVEKLYDNFSAATVLQQVPGGIFEGDSVE